MFALLFLVLTIWVDHVASTSVSFFNGCPQASIYVSYSLVNDMTSYEDIDTVYLFSSMSELVDISATGSLYYWVYNATGTVNGTLVGSGTFTFATSSGNAAGYVLLGDNTCGVQHIELSDSYNDKYSVVYINSAGTSKYTYFFNAANAGTTTTSVGAVGTALSDNVNIMDGNSSYTYAYVAFYDSNISPYGNEDIMYLGDVNIPPGGALFILDAYLPTSDVSTLDSTSSFLTAFSPSGKCLLVSVSYTCMYIYTYVCLICLFFHIATYGSLSEGENSATSCNCDNLSTGAICGIVAACLVVWIGSLAAVYTVMNGRKVVTDQDNDSMALNKL